jgi:hypothetical protein
MIAVDTRGHSGGRQAAGHELQQGHLRRGILHGHTVGLEFEVCGAADSDAIVSSGEEGFGWVVEVGVEDFFGEGKLSVGGKSFADGEEIIEDFGVRRGARGKSRLDWARGGSF